ncbi:MAG: rod-binding protein [Synergistaceae bacterium]|nr:rod-binding protein [Synergistaceae bacterium]
MEIKVSDLISSSIGSLSSDVLKAQSRVEASADDNFENMLTAALNANDDKKLKDACTQFEEMMIGMIYKQMKATIIRAEEAKDPGRDLYEQWQDEAMVKEMAKNGSFGLANMMYKQLSKRMQNEFILNED